MKPRHAYPAFPHLETERLTLREIRSSDQTAIFTLFSSEAVTRFYNLETLRRPEQAQRVTQWFINRFRQREGIRWGITLKGGDDALIGTCGYNSWNRQNAYGEIGYDLHTDYWNRGLMSEAVRCIVQYGFVAQHLNRIEAWVVVGNLASERVLTKLGFKREGLLRQRGRWKGAFHDLQMFALLREEFG